MTSAKYPLQGMLERFADSKGIKMMKMAQLEKRPSLDEYLQDKLNLLNLKDKNENPLILVGRNNRLALSYRGYMVGLVGAKLGTLSYIPTGLIVAENEYRTLVLEASVPNEKSGIYKKSGAGIFCQLVDNLLLRILPDAMKEENKGINVYDASLDFTPSNLRHVGGLLEELF